MAIKFELACLGASTDKESEHGLELTWTGDGGIYPPEAESCWHRGGERLWGANSELCIGDLILENPKSAADDLPDLDVLRPITKIREVWRTSNPTPQES